MIRYAESFFQTGTVEIIQTRNKQLQGVVIAFINTRDTTDSERVGCHIDGRVIKVLAYMLTK